MEEPICLRWHHLNIFYGFLKYEEDFNVETMLHEDTDYEYTEKGVLYQLGMWYWLESLPKDTVFQITDRKDIICKDCWPEYRKFDDCGEEIREIKSKTELSFSTVMGFE
ncbi:hypothetical protein HOF46_03560, partial [Candidatus Woesearchaeota archaeon]|nr:hypothetical protein [Candidatus Woesearchaeota archaeon]